MVEQWRPVGTRAGNMSVRYWTEIVTKLYVLVGNVITRALEKVCLKELC